MIGAIGIILGIAVLIYLAYNRWNALICSVVAALVVGLLNGMSFWGLLTDNYLKGAMGFFQTYLFVFLLAALYGRVLSDTGCASAIAYKVLDWFSPKRVILVLSSVVFLLTYGGVSVFVVIFVVYPIAIVLMKEAKITKALMPAIVLFGALTGAQTAMPGTPQLANVIASQVLGTPPTAAPILGITASVLMFVLGNWYLSYMDKKYQEKGMVFDASAVKDLDKITLERENCPNAIIAFTPLVLLIVLYSGLANGWFVPKMDTIVAVNTAMIVATAVTMVLNWKRLKNVQATLLQGSTEWVWAGLNVALILGFATVVSATPGFAWFVKYITNMPGHPFIQVAVASNIIGFITASASATVKITLAALGKHWLATGVDPQILARVVAIASVGLSVAPHSGGMFAVFSVAGENHKSAYKDVFMATGGVSIIALIVVILLGIMGIR